MHSNGRATVRLLVIGTSRGEVCGVRDYGHVVGRALRDEGAQVEFDWWEQDSAWSVGRTVGEHSSWLQRLDASVRASSPEWIVWHYSVFAWGTGGIPYLAPRTAARIRRLGVPIVLVAHELAFPFGRAGWKGFLWAATQRVGLTWPVHASKCVVVTTEERLRWLRSRWWLSTRRACFLPVCSNVSANGSVREAGSDVVLGVFGFGSPDTLARETTRAVARLRSDGIDARLVLVGAPGPGGREADRWRSAAEDAGLGDALAFTGVLSPESLGRELQAADILVLPDRGGPSSRKGTVAAALALGKPAVAVDGPDRWGDLVADDAVALAEPSADGLANALRRLARSSDDRRAQGERAAAFYHLHMTPAHLAKELLSFLGSNGEVRA